MTAGTNRSFSEPGSGISCNRIFVLFIFSLLTSFNVQAQENSDFGAFAGTSYYMGDLNSSGHYAIPSFAVGPIYRYNFNHFNSLRFHAIYHTLSGSSTNYWRDFSGGGTTEFSTNFVDLGLDFEFNWEKYKTAHRRTKATPYVFAGLGYELRVAGDAPGGSEGLSIPITTPFGIGYKINLGRWLSGGIEASARKVWTDNIDGAENPPVYRSGSSRPVFSPFGNKDWVFFTGVFVTYKFYKFWEDCPTYDEDNIKKKRRNGSKIANNKR